MPSLAQRCVALGHAFRFLPRFVLAGELTADGVQHPFAVDQMKMKSRHDLDA